MLWHYDCEENLYETFLAVDAERVERSEDVIDGNGKTALKNPFSKTKQMAEGTFCSVCLCMILLNN